MGRYQRHPVGLPAQPACAPVTGSISLPLVDVRGTPESGDDVIACITCHDVHATAARNLLRWPSDREAEACSTCHRVNGNACPDGSLARNGGRS
jgi:predicted CXXCH cytochrome family protein